MFVTITRAGGARELRVLASAIAYVDEAVDFTIVKLTSGEAIRASEDRATLEERIDKALCGDLIVGELVTDLLQPAPSPSEAAPPAPVEGAPATAPTPKAPAAKPTSQPKSERR